MELCRVDRERLQLAQDVGEPEAQEPDAPLLDDGLDVVRRAGLIHARTLTSRSEPRLRPRAQLADRRLERATHLRERVAVVAALDDPPRLELLHPLGQQPVAELGYRLADLAEAQRTCVEQHGDDRPGPAAADELDRLVVVGAAGLLLHVAEATPRAASATPRPSRRPARRRPRSPSR